VKGKFFPVATQDTKNHLFICWRLGLECFPICRRSAGYAPPEQGVLEPMTSGWDWSSCKSAVSEPDHR